MPHSASRLAHFSYPSSRRWCTTPFYGSLCILVFLYAINYRASPLRLSHRLVSSNASPALYPQCASDPRSWPQSLRQLPAGEKYMFYTPHSGFNNQIGELKNALLIAALLNRTLILPPVFDHHAVALGSCPKFKVHEPAQMRSAAWSHISELIRSGRYLAIADVIDISAVLSLSLVKTIDLRIFASLWCGVDVSTSCSGSLCSSLVTAASSWGTLESCGALLSRPEAVHGDCVYGVNEDCRTTIWINGLENLNISHPEGIVQQHQVASPMVHQAVNPRKGNKQYTRRYKDIEEALGMGSKAARYEVLSFGSLFSSEYKGTQLHVDIRPRKNKALIEAVQFLPFTPDIIHAGKLYSKEKIRHPFFCAQVRLLDGQFKNHWVKTFTSVKSQLQLVQNQRGLSDVLHVFLMTDLPVSNWTNTYLGELARNTSLYKIHILEDEDDLVFETSQKLLKRELGLQSGFLPQMSLPTGFDLRQDPEYIPEVILYIQEMICSCATLGFVGTSGSTIADNIVQLRNANMCTSTSVDHD